MKIIVTGATGMAGSGVIRQAIADEDLHEIIALARRPLEIAHPKIKTAVHHDFHNCDAVRNSFKYCGA
jgi:uncharacterized protein YbjT (DUF2867 family)